MLYERRVVHQPQVQHFPKGILRNSEVHSFLMLFLLQLSFLIRRTLFPNSIALGIFPISSSSTTSPAFIFPFLLPLPTTFPPVHQAQPHFAWTQKIACTRLHNPY